MDMCVKRVRDVCLVNSQSFHLACHGRSSQLHLRYTDRKPYRPNQMKSLYEFKPCSEKQTKAPPEFPVS